MIRKINVYLWLLLLLTLTACKSERTETEPVTELVTEPISEPVTSAVIPGTTIASAEITADESSSSIAEEATRVDADGYTHLVWVNSYFNFVSEEALDELNRVLKEKGIRCVVELTPVSDVTGEDYINWLEQLKNEGRAPDIVPAGFWSRGTYDGSAFVEKNLYPLNDYLSTEEGKNLWKNYGEAEWKSVTVNGKIYNVPLRWLMLTGTRSFRAQYMYVNNKYKDSFEKIYDGSYASLHQLLNMHADSNLIISTQNLGRIFVLGLLNCNLVDVAYYDQDLNEFVDVTRSNELKSLLQQIYKDFQEGRIVNGISNGLPESVIPENTLVYIPEGPLYQNKELEGYTPYILSHDLFGSSVSISTGVLASSPYRELAVQVLGVCYSDPKLASLVNWKKENETAWLEWTEYANARGVGPVSGFLPKLSDEEVETLYKQYMDVTELCGNLTQMGKGDSYLVYLNNFFDNPKDYGNVYEVINAQFKEWCENETK